jgi:bifunctional ADP-heptose synthase (sugar kinase/adenylyltransferase)
MTKRSKKQLAPAPSVDLVALADYVERFSTKTVVVLGDFVADAFQFGDITRVSREAPVLILKHRETQIVPGGGANAANNFAALGAKVIPVTAVGEDQAGDSLLEFFRQKKVDVSGIVRVKADALAVSDYGFGVANPPELGKILSSNKRPPLATLDSRYRLTDYKHSRLHSATPNEGEIEALHHTAIGKNLAELERCGRATLEQMKLESLVITRGRDGMALFQRGMETVHIPVHGSDQAVDVTGAGDTVLAAYTLGLTSGATPLEAAHLANIAGGLVVMKRGTATVSRAELLEAIGSSASGKTS